MRLLNIAIKIALIDLLHTLDIVPQVLIDSSIGEIFGAYCDRLINMKQALFLAYYIATFEIGMNTIISNVIDPGSHDNLINILENITKNNLTRTNKLINTSRLSLNFNYGSYEYFKEQFTTPTNLNEKLNVLPRESILIEISSNNIKSNLITETITLCKNGKFSYPNILSAIGQFYCHGLNPKLQALLHPVLNPVCCGTPYISPIIGWDHSKDWFVPTYPEYFELFKKIITIDKDNHDDQHHWGHVVNGQATLSTPAYLIMVWKFLAQRLDKKISEFPIEFENIKLHLEVNLNAKSKHNFTLYSMINTGQFEITYNSKLCVTGVARYFQASKLHTLRTKNFKCDKYFLDISEIKTELQMRNLNFEESLISLKKVTLDGAFGQIQYDGDLFSFIFGAILMKTFSDKLRYPQLLVGFKMRFDPSYFHNKNYSIINIFQNNQKNIIYTENMFIEGLEVFSTSKDLINDFPLIDCYTLLPNRRKYLFHLPKSGFSLLNEKGILTFFVNNLKIFKNIISEKIKNSPITMRKINFHPSKISDIVDDMFKNNIFEGNFISNYVKIVFFYKSNTEGENSTDELFREIHNSNAKKFFIILIINSEPELYERLTLVATCLSEVAINSIQLLLFEKSHDLKDVINYSIDFTSFPQNYESLNNLKNILIKYKLQPGNHFIRIVSQNSYNDGIIGMSRCLLKEVNHNYSQISITNIRHSKLKYKEIFRKIPEISIINENLLSTYQHVRLKGFWKNKRISSRKSRLLVEKPGDNRSLKWHHIDDENMKSSNLISVYYCGINLVDLKLIKSKIMSSGSGNSIFKNTLGVDFSGRDGFGNKFMGICNHKAISTFIESR